MNLDLIIEQLRQYCAPLGGRVGGAADFETGVETVIQIIDPITKKLAYPSAVVFPLDDDPTANTDPDGLMIGLEQFVTETIGVIVEFDAKADRRGQGGVSQVEAMKYALFKALLNFYVDLTRAPKGLSYAGGSLLTFDRERLFWEYRFSQVALITDGDGFPISGDPLIDITSTIPVAQSVPIVIDANADNTPQTEG